MTPRGRFWALAGAVASILAVAANASTSSRDVRAPIVDRLRVDNGAAPFKGDHRLLTTITPNGDGRRESARVVFSLSEPATVRFTVARTAPGPRDVFSRSVSLRRGSHVLAWSPRAEIEPRTYVVRLVVSDRSGNRRRYGPSRPGEGPIPDTPVIRVQGIDAGFARASYGPGSVAGLRIASDAEEIAVQIFRAGPEQKRTRRRSVMLGEPVTDELRLDWRRHRSVPRRVRLRLGLWPSGLYFARLTAADGRVGFAPFVLRSLHLGEHPVAVVMPTNTWQAYNFQDVDADGYGDTWYAVWSRRSIRLGRPYLQRGVPANFSTYDLHFLRWLSRAGHDVDFLSDTDLGHYSGDDLADAYTLIVFPGHHEYMTRPAFDAVERFRDRGGNLMFLSANNFFWRVDSRGSTLVKRRLWRQEGRPEARLIGVQYRRNDRGGWRGSFTVRNESEPWLLEGTGLRAGSRFGSFGIEMDTKTAQSPAGTKVIADMRNLHGRGVTAQMTYYETKAGAKVFAAGAFTLAGSSWYEPQRRLLTNLWDRLSQP